jgi:hypothetical protein
MTPAISWIMALHLIVSYCGSLSPGNGSALNDCRTQRSDCIQRGADRHSLNDSVVAIINACLTNPNQFNEPFTPPPPPAPKAKAKKAKADEKKP